MWAEVPRREAENEEIARKSRKRKQCGRKRGRQWQRVGVSSQRRTEIAFLRGRTEPLAVQLNYVILFYKNIFIRAYFQKTIIHSFLRLDSIWL